jgi:hypothetical protein
VHRQCHHDVKKFCSSFSGKPNSEKSPPTKNGKEVKMSDDDDDEFNFFRHKSAMPLTKVPVKRVEVPEAVAIRKGLSISFGFQLFDSLCLVCVLSQR